MLAESLARSRRTRVLRGVLAIAFGALLAALGAKVRGLVRQAVPAH